jgi:PLP dependent protein
MTADGPAQPTRAVDSGDVAARVREVRRRIAAAGGDDRRIRIVAVTKGFGPDAVRAAMAAGVCDVGENYADELVAKQAAVEVIEADAPTGAPTATPTDAATDVTAAATPSAATPSATATPSAATTPAPLTPPSGGDRADGGCRWHFLGRVQRNKVRRLAPSVHLWQGVDRAAAGREIASRAPGARVLVQLNVSGLERRNGCVPADAPALVGELRAMELDVVGLMAVGPGGPPENARSAYRDLAAMADRLELPERSMGMTDDLEVAVEEGTTMVRVGRALFGARPVPTDLRR